MAESTREGARGELFVVCPRGHENHIMWMDRPAEVGTTLLDDSELAALHQWTYEGGPVAFPPPVRCADCGVSLVGMSIEGREP